MLVASARSGGNAEILAGRAAAALPGNTRQTWLRLAGQHVPAIYGPSGDVKWDEADPTYSVDAARRGA